MTQRERLVVEAHAIIARGSQSFATASRLFDKPTRERAWLLYAWCRAADDMIDGQELGHGAAPPVDPAEAQARLEALTAAALDGDDNVPVAFAALREVARETAMPRRFIADHLAGFALDAEGWRPQSEADLLRYCYHVAGTVGCMMAVVMGVAPEDEDTLDRACDLGLAFQLANIARDVVPDAVAERFYLPADWLTQACLSEGDLALPQHRKVVADLASRLVLTARNYRHSARVGAARLPFRSRLAVLSADEIYGTIGERVLKLGPAAWDSRARVSTAGKLRLIGLAAWRGIAGGPIAGREGLWTRPRQS